MRIVVDVSPLSAPRTGIGNYILGMVGGTAEAAGDDDSVVAFALAGPRGARRIRDVLSGLPVEQRIVVVPPTSQTWRTAWSRLGWPRVERFAGELDVFHFSDWMYPPQRGGLRSTMIHDLGTGALSGLGGASDQTDARAQVPQRGADLRPRLRQLRVHGERRGRAAGDPTRAHPRGLSGSERRVHAGGRAGRLRTPLRPGGRDAGAAEERRAARRGVRAGSSRSSRARPRRRRGRGDLGAEPARG